MAVVTDVGDEGFDSTIPGGEEGLGRKLPVSEYAYLW